MKHDTISDPVACFRAARRRTRELFEIIVPEAYYDRPIALRNPIVFYEGHLPAFAVNTLLKLAHGRKGLDDHFETIFARGIDPADEASATTPTDVWPEREQVQAYARAAEALIEETLATTESGEATFTILEHELMHQETLVYLLHQLDYARKRPPAAAPVTEGTARRVAGAVAIPPGPAHLGQAGGTFGWDNEFPAHTVHVPEFSIDAQNVTNGAYLEYMEATGAAAPHFWMRGEDEWWWRGMFAVQPLPLDAPAYVTHAEAAAFARWKGARLPTEAELDRATWGERPAIDGNFDFRHWDPVPAGSYEPNGWGLYDLLGNGWEWTSTLFEGFAGFRPMRSYPQYSSDFFDGQHYVLKGASPVTPRELVRRSFRNWFRPGYPYVYATFRCAR